MNKISTVSRVVKNLILLVALLHIIVSITGLLTQSSESQYATTQGESQFNLTTKFDVPEVWQALAQELSQLDLNPHLLLNVPELIFFMFIYLSLFRLFSAYQNGDVFSPATIQSLKNIGSCLLIWPVFTLIYPILLVVLLKVMGISEQLTVFASVSSNELIKLLAGTAIYVIAWIMFEAQTLENEQELTI